MKNPIFLVFIHIILKSIQFTFAKTNPESNMYEDISAILIPCPKNSVNNTCEPHLIINIHMNPSIDLNNLEDSWILDEVYDPTKRRISKIISPYLIVVGRGEPVVMYPLQYEESIKHKQFGKEQPTKEDKKNPKGLPSSLSDEPGSSINMKEREEVGVVQGSPSPKIDQPLPLINIKEREDEPPSDDDANEYNPSITMKRIVDGKDVQVSPSDQNNEPRPSINMNERKDEQANEIIAKGIQDSPSLKTDEPGPSINLKEQEDEQTTNDDVMARQGILSIKTNEANPTINEPGPSINMNEREGEQATRNEVKNLPDFQSLKTDKPLPSINLKEREDEQPNNDDVMARQGIMSIKTNEANPTINEPGPSININERQGEQATGNEVKNVQDSQSLKTNKPLPSINLIDWEDEVLNDSQGSLSSNTNPSINTKISEGGDVKGFPFGQNNEPGPSPLINMKEREDEQPTDYNIKDSQLQSSKTNDLLNPITIKKLEDVEEIKSSGGTKEPIYMEKYDESEDLQRPSFDKAIDINVKERKEPNKDDAKNIQDFRSRNESEIDEASRLKRHEGLVFASKKSVGFNITFLQKTPPKSTNWNPQEPFFDPSSIASLGLIEVRDPSLKKSNPIEKPKELQRVHNKNPKYSQNKDEKKKVFRSNQYNNRELDMKDRSKVKQIEEDREASLHNTGDSDNQLLEMNSKNNFYQEGMERDYHLKRNRHPDNIKQKDVKLNDQIIPGNKRKHIEEEIENYKPSFITQENLLTYNIRNENHPVSIGSYSNENNLPPRSQSLNGFPHEKEGNHYFKSQDTFISHVNACPHEKAAVQNKFKLPYNSLFDKDNAPDIEQNDRYAFKQHLNVPTDLNDRKGEFFNAKTAEQIYTGNYSPNESIPQQDIKNKYYNIKTAENNIYKGNYQPERGDPEQGINNKYYNAKTTENIYKGNDLSQGRDPEYEIKNKCYNSKTAENNIYTGNDLPQGGVPELERTPEYYNAKVTENNALPQGRFPKLERKNNYYNAKTAQNNIYIKKDLPQKRDPEYDRKDEYYNAKTTENVYKGNNNLMQKRVPEYDRKNEYYNAKTTENVYKQNDLIQERAPEIDRKDEYYNAKTAENIYKGNDLIQEQVPEIDRKNEYYNAKTTENIYKGNDLMQERAPEYDKKNEFYNSKTTENIYKENDLMQERVPEYDKKNEYYNAKATENVYKGSDLIQERVPEFDRKDEYYNAKTAENIYKGSDLLQDKVPEIDRKDEYYNEKTTENIYKENDPIQERVPEYDPKNEYYNAKTTENIYKGKDLIQERVPEHEIKNEHYTAQTATAENIIYPENELPEKRVPEYDRKNEYNNDKTTDNTYKGKYIIQERVPELDRKNEYYNAKESENSFKGRDLPQEKVPEVERKNEYYNAKAAENNIYKGYELHQGRVPEHNIKDVYYNVKTAENISRHYYPSSPEREKFNFNEPVKSPSGINDAPYLKGYDQSNVNSHASSFRNNNVYSLRRSDINLIINQHMRENLQKKNIYENNQTFYGKNPRTIPYNINREGPESSYFYKNGQQFDWKNSQIMPNNFNPNDLYADLGPPFLHSKLPRNKPFSYYPRTNSYKSVPRNYKRIRRSNSERSREVARYENNPDPEKNFNLQKIEENGEVPCDTCGGKNKKKDDKQPARYCSALTEAKSLESKLEDFNAQGKLNDVIPCDTCGGKNKKVGGKPLPGGLDSEIHREKAEIVQQLTAEDMIPCEKCKVNREGNLASQSCGCVSNPSVCNCEGSKLSRAPNQSKEDINYGVFNMNDPIPYLTTQLRIFRRRHNTWWRIVPIVSVDSVSGIFANKNMSMIFSTRVGTLRQEKSARFVDHKLVIPLTSDDQLTESKSIDTLTELQKNIGKSFLIGSSRNGISNREIKNFEDRPIRGIDILGHFPVSMKAMQMCPHNNKNLCLNIRGERVPEFSIKVKIPFRENAFMVTNKHVIKIFSIITDATTKDALHISIDVINKGLEAHEYSIYVYNCPLTKSTLSTTSVRRQLQPDIGQTVTFLLPFINGGKKNKKFSCDVVVKESDLKHSNKSFFMKSADIKEGIIARRSMDIRVHSRCFCIARCSCHCMEKTQTFVNYKVCDRLSRTAQEEAGLIYNCPPGNEKNDVCITDCSRDSQKKTSFNLFYYIESVILIILIWLLFFGVLKAIFGLCIQSIDKWGFETVQPGRYYACTSRIRIFIVNVFFFIIYPFACWCKCFKPKPEDLMAASTDWSCNHEMDDGDCSLGENKDSETRLRGGENTQKLSENLLLAFAPHYENGLFKDDKPDDEESTAFILEVLEESKSSLSKMMSQSTNSYVSPEIVSNCAENSEEDRTAEELVDSLKTSQRAYRIMSSPVGGVTNIPENCQYCLKGFFLPTIKGTYEFISYHPLVQYIGISEENEVIKLKKPEYLHTDEFTRNYANKLEVLKAGDLSVGCPPNIPCINITPLNDLESSFVKLSALLKEKHTD